MKILEIRNNENSVLLELDKKNQRKWWFFILNKIKLCLMILFSEKYKPTIKINNEIEIDFSANKIVFSKPLHIHCKEDITLSSEKNIIINSGRSEDPRRPGYTYGIWLNCPVDENNLPLKKS